MNILTENDRAYVVKCNKGHVFDHSGQDECMRCPVCAEEDETMAVVSRWWATAGWPVHDLPPLMAPAMTAAPPPPYFRSSRAARVA